MISHVIFEHLGENVDVKLFTASDKERPGLSCSTGRCIICFGQNLWTQELSSQMLKGKRRRLVNLTYNPK
jgi:hypothetical protein